MVNLRYFLLVFLNITFFYSRSIVGQNSNFATVVVEKSEVLINPESNKEIAFPAFIRTAPDYFLVYDAILQKIFQFDYGGAQLLSFGNEGRGPGEFLSLTNFWIIDDQYLLYDYNGAKMILYNSDGTFEKEYPIDINELTPIVAALSLNKFVYPLKNNKKSLLKLVDFKNDTFQYIGEVEYEPIERSNPQIRLLLGANKSGVFSFNSENATLEKFDIYGELLWKRDLKIPNVDGILEHYKEINKKQGFYPLTYARDMHVTSYGVAILLNTPPDNIATSVVWIPNNGSEIRIVEYPNIQMPSTFTFRFRISFVHNTILFSNSLEGKIIKSNWPVEIDSP